MNFISFKFPNICDSLGHCTNKHNFINSMLFKVYDVKQSYAILPNLSLHNPKLELELILQQNKYLLLNLLISYLKYLSRKINSNYIKVQDFFN